MAAAQLLTLTHGVDDKATRIDNEVKCVSVIVNDIGDTVRVAHKGARNVIFRTESCLNVCFGQMERKQKQSCNVWQTTSAK